MNKQHIRNHLLKRRRELRAEYERLKEMRGEIADMDKLLVLSRESEVTFMLDWLDLQND